jgi:alpha-D-glucose phosphate-specific phosphoglucomutase
LEIRFGTSGWRGIIAREFTWDRVDAVVDAIAVFMTGRGRRSVVVGCDTRFLSPEMAEAAARRLAAAGFEVVLADRPTPTPVLSHAVRRLSAGGVVNFTASHNPFLYNGIKYSPWHGGPAGGDITSEIERLIEAGARPAPAGGSVSVTDLVSPYVEDLPRFLDVEAFRRAGLRVVYDPFNGTGSGILDGMLRSWGASVRTIHAERDPLFAGRHPEPNARGMLDASREVVVSGASIGLATDGDADRFGLVDEHGVYVSPHDFLALLLDYLAGVRGLRGAAVRSVSTGSLLDRVASARGIEVVETPVGFKYLGAAMLEREVLLAGEESGGLSIGGHVPEKDGILACLLAAEMVAARGEGLSAMLEKLWGVHGRLYQKRLDLELTDRTRARLKSAVLDSPPSSVGGIGVVSSDTLDGLRLHLDGGGWLLFRLSGTEPLARVYIQAGSPEMLDALESSLRDLIG